MLHREPDEEGIVDFRQVAGLNRHGLYHNDISEETCKEILKSVKKYESDFLRKKCWFIREIEKHFKKHNLKQSRQMYDRKMREYAQCKDIEVYVFFRGTFKKEIISKHIINQ